MKSIHVYGIPNCDTTKKTINWLNKHNLVFTFHDYKKEGISLSRLKLWSKAKGWQTILNKKSTTWRSIDPVIQSTIVNEQKAIKLMQENSSLIKRPVIETDQEILVGYSEAEFISSLLKK